jgi:hypothetical protein
MKGTFCFLAALALSAVIHSGAFAQQDIDKIIKGLDSDQESEVFLALRSLQTQTKNAEKAIPSLVTHLESRNPRLVVEAAIALLRIDKDYSDRVVTRMLTDPKVSAYASRLWVTHPVLTLGPLTEACANPATESTALAGLQMSLQVVRSKPFAKTPEYTKQAEITAARLLAIVEDEDSVLASRMLAAAMFSELSPSDAFRTLPVVLDSIASSANSRFTSAAILRPVMDDVTPILLDEFKSHPWPSSAATSLAYILATNHASSYPFIVEAASSPDVAVRYGCALTFGQPAIANYRQSTTTPVLTALMHDEHPAIRAVACRATVDHYPDLVGEAVGVVFELIDQVDDGIQLHEILKTLADIGERATKYPSDSVLRLLEEEEQQYVHPRAAIAVLRVWPKEAAKVFPTVTKIIDAAKVYGSENKDVLDAVQSIGKLAEPLTPNLINCFESLDQGAGRRLPTQVLDLRYAICKILLGIEPNEIANLDRMLEIVDATPYSTGKAQGLAIWDLVERKDNREKVQLAFTSLMENNSIYARELKVHAAAGLLALFPENKDNEKAVTLLRQSINSYRTTALTSLTKIGKHAEPLMNDVAVFIRPGSTTELKLALDILRQIGPPAKAHIPAIETVAKTTTGTTRTAAEEALKSIRGE